MAWKKVPPELAEIFDRALPDDPRIDRRKMFGYPCAFVNGNMLTGTHEDNVIVRLPEKQRDELLASGRARQFEPMKGRVMREYVLVPRAATGDARALASWLSDAFRYTAGLAAKPKKAKARSPRKKAK